jgi:hypothetical protein
LRTFRHGVTPIGRKRKRREPRPDRAKRWISLREVQDVFENSPAIPIRIVRRKK